MNSSCLNTVSTGRLRYTPEQLAAWTGGAWTRRPEKFLCGCTQDTRRLKPGDVYVAIRGEHFDGHDFIGHASGIGAAAALVNADCSGLETSAIPCLVVPDTRKALQGMAAAYRRTWTGKVVGVTGSVGKTTCKELIADILQTAGPTSRTQGNYNNEIGLPLSLLNAGNQDACGVFEVGMSHPGEIAKLSRWLKPDVGVLTPVGLAHAASFEDVSAIQREKSALLAEVSPEGFCVLNADLPGLDGFIERSAALPVTVALEGGADWTGEWRGREWTVLLNHEEILSCQPIVQAPFMARNILTAVAVAYHLGVRPDWMVEVLNRFTPPGLRWKRETWKERNLILDCYNANPLSMQAALEALKQTPTEGSRWAVLGDMLELGPEEESLHRDVGIKAARLGLHVLGVGLRGQWIAEAALEAGATAAAATDVDQAVRWLDERVREGDVCLFKASRGAKLEVLVECWKKEKRS